MAHRLVASDVFEHCLAFGFALIVMPLFLLGIAVA
jgi:hypothetical protein